MLMNSDVGSKEKQDPTPTPIFALFSLSSMVLLAMTVRAALVAF